MASVTEQAIISRLATEFESIAGIKTTYGFAQNPDTLTNVALPAIVFVPVQFESSLKGHHNTHMNDIQIAGVLFVSERQAQGGKLSFLENEAMPYLFKVRKQFQQDAVIRRILELGLVQANLLSGQYGAGGPLLTFGGVEYIGNIFRWNFVEVN